MIFEYIALFFAGFISTIYGAFSGGAAILTVPAMLLFGLAPAASVATNRLIIFLAASTRLPLVYGKLELGLKIPAVIVVVHTIGAVVGAFALLGLEEKISLPLVGMVLIFGAIITWFSPKGIEKKQKKGVNDKLLVFACLSMFVIGIYRGFFGPAAGILSRLVFVHLLGLNFTQTLTLSSYSTFFSSLAALLIFLNASLIDFSFGIPLAVGAVLGVIVSTKFALEKGDNFMKAAFVALTLLFGLYFVFFGGK